MDTASIQKCQVCLSSVKVKNVKYKATGFFKGNKKNIYKLFTDNAVFQRFVDLTIYNTECPLNEIWFER